MATRKPTISPTGAGRRRAAAKAAAQAAKAAQARPAGNAWLSVRGARHNNLKNIDVHFPLARFICVTGVSGSGKSSLVVDILREVLSYRLNGAENVEPGQHDSIEGLEHLDKVIDIDQKPIGRTPRSNPGTYIKVFDEIRDLYALLPDSKVRGYKPGRFSFNVAAGEGGGRCEACEGNGANRIDMEFLADIWVPCPVCGGHRFGRETLAVRYKGKSIADVLEMDVQEALDQFANQPKIEAMLRTLHEVGLDYIKLGQSSTTLSGGEAQRIKLARELVRRSTGRTLYLLDEPTTGLHFEDIRRLLTVLHGFVDAGNTVVVIEHNLDVIKTADWVIDLGPEGGEAGGRIVVEGTPEQVAACGASYTGQALAVALAPRVPAPVAAATGGKRRRKGAAPKGSERTAPREMTEVRVIGASQHNLKDVTASFPRGKISVCSGVSGSGKSSFAMDTVYAEGQRRYLESLSAYARQFLGQLTKPRVEHIEGLSPAISIEQKTTSRSPRSTVGTVTEVFDYMRVLWARIGVPWCPKCDLAITALTADEIVDRMLDGAAGRRALILAPLQPAEDESWASLLAREKANGYARVRINGKVHEIDTAPVPGPRSRASVELVADRVVLRADQRPRLTESVEAALGLGDGWVIVADAEGASERRFSQRRACTQCGTVYEDLTPHHFSFNTRLGWCRTCEGLGIQHGASPSLIVPEPRRSLRQGAISGWDDLDANAELAAMVKQIADHLGCTLEQPWHAMPEMARRAFLYGTGGHWFSRPDGVRFQWKGFYPAIDEAAKSSFEYRQRLSHLTTEIPCQACGGGRIREDAGAVRVGQRTIVEVGAMSLDAALSYFQGLELDARQRKVAGELLVEIVNRLRFLVDVGLEYVTLNRSAPTLSGGESQRIRLASQIGSGLTGVLYVLDEPTIGLHPRDTTRLLGALTRLRDLGNTLLMVEHDREVIEQADYVLDFGPGAGAGGGEVVASGNPAKLKKAAGSLTGRYLAGRELIPIPAQRRSGNGHLLEVIGARHNNLRNIDVAFPLGCFIVVTGVSGSGKSSLVNDVLHAALAKRLHRATSEAGGHDELRGIEYVDKVINVDQSPIGNSPTSNAATYTGVFDQIRELFARVPEAKVRGYSANRFSFNRPGGRCEPCEGNGQRLIEMHFLPDVWVTCEECGGRRYNPETLEVRYRGKNIADVLELPVAQALEHFANQPRIRRMLATLADVGLGYLPLGQAGPTLSGGEAQRVKLAAELGRPSTGKTIYLLDEPTTGLHFDDLRRLLEVLQRLCDLGNTVICIEHNPDIIKSADWIVDMGPEGGDGGGSVVAEGPPEAIARVEASHTGAVLRGLLAAEPVAERQAYTAPVPEAFTEPEIDQADLGEARMPWQVDGRKWHTRQRVGTRGEQCRWEGPALEWLIDEIEAAGKGKFSPTNYNNRSTVEIKMPGSQTPWFFHARTGHAWLLDLSFRVPLRSFSAAEVRRLVPLRVLDECDELPIYGREPRVNVRHSGRVTDDIRILVHSKEEIATPACREFIQGAVKAYQRLVRKMAEDILAHQPWKLGGKGWHVGRQILSKREQAGWRGSLLIELLATMKKAAPGITEDWTRKVMVLLSHPQVSGTWARFITNHAHALRVEIRCRRGQFTPALVERLGMDVTIRHLRLDDQVQFWMQRMDQCDAQQLARLVKDSIVELSERTGAE